MASSLPRRRRRTHAPKSSSTVIDDIFCQECGSGHSPAKLLLCDKCDRGYHLFCLRPILPSVPKGSWFCGSCSNHKPKYAEEAKARWELGDVEEEKETVALRAE
ncbi:hypothetical protein V8G54_020083 [Vigna mungo]|uniref:PHD-type domain-containing protein n=1 Tax=Vigna mungo TaxID=3915 RepID=A0AAQ3RUC9_VIGMU